jgi:hypothetical protein
MVESNDAQSKKNNRRQISTGMGLGVVLGIVLGLAMNNIALGLGIGIVVGGFGIVLNQLRTGRGEDYKL